MGDRIAAGVMVALLALLAPRLSAQEGVDASTRSAPPPGSQPAHPFWPQFHGPRGDNKSPDQGLLTRWPAGGPKLLWTYDQCGVGFATVSLADGRIFTTGDFDSDEKVLALSLDGNSLWTAPNGKAWKSPWAGSRTTPTYNDGMVYQLNAFGLLSALEAATGKPVWSIEFPKDGISQGGFAESVVIDGNNLICMPGSKDVFIQALDKKTGRTVWVSDYRKTGYDHASYVTPLVVEHDGRKDILHASLFHLISLDARTGRTRWSLRHNYAKHCSVVAATPIWHGGRVFLTLGYGVGSQVFRVAPDGNSAAQAWKHDGSDCEHGGAILHDGFVYVSGKYQYPRGGWREQESREGKLYCLDFASGREMWAEQIGRCSLTYADGRLYCLTELGRMYLIEASPDRCNIVGQFDIPKKDKVYSLSHPVVIGGRLYIRHQNLLLVYDVSR